MVPVWLPVPVILNEPTSATPMRLLSPPTRSVPKPALKWRSGVAPEFPATIVLESVTEVPVPPRNANSPPPLDPLPSLFEAVLPAMVLF